MAEVISVIPSGFEPETDRLEICCSIQLSYGTFLSLKFKVPTPKSTAAMFMLWTFELRLSTLICAAKMQKNSLKIFALHYVLNICYLVIRLFYGSGTEYYTGFILFLHFCQYKVFLLQLVKSYF